MNYDIFHCNWVATRWQLFSIHKHTNNTGNVTKQTVHRTTQKYMELSFYFTSHHITRHGTVLISKLLFKIINSFTALKNISPFHFTSLHFTFYFILFLFFFTCPINPTLHFTLLFITTTYFPSPHVPLLCNFYRFYFPSLVYIFLTLVLKICVLPWEVPIAPSGSLFQSVMVLFTIEYFPITVLWVRGFRRFGGAESFYF
jgi:hypothetical protein